jgi:hypothetical protein
MKPSPHGPNGVHFIQFLFPHGTKSDQWIERPPEIALKARALWAAGFRLEIENKSGMIWMSCVHHSQELAVDKTCWDGPEVPVKVDEMIRDAHAKFIRVPPL